MIKHLTLAAALVMTAGMAAADPVEGLWKTQPDGDRFATVRITTCGSKICGTMHRAYNLQGQRVASDQDGARMIWDMVPQGGGKYRNGKIRNPATGKVYSSKMQLDGSQLKVSGCIGPICRTQVWSR